MPGKAALGELTLRDPIIVTMHTFLLWVALGALQACVVWAYPIPGTAATVFLLATGASEWAYAGLQQRLEEDVAGTVEVEADDDAAVTAAIQACQKRQLCRWRKKARKGIGAHI